MFATICRRTDEFTIDCFREGSCKKNWTDSHAEYRAFSLPLLLPSERLSALGYNKKHSRTLYSKLSWAGFLVADRELEQDFDTFFRFVMKLTPFYFACRHASSKIWDSAFTSAIPISLSGTPPLLKKQDGRVQRRMSVALRR